MKRGKWLKLLTAGMMICAIAAITGCGTNNESEPKKTAEAQAVLKIGTNPTYVPLEYTDENGNYKGFELDIAQAVAKELGMKPEIKSIKFDGLIPALQTDQIDMIASGMVMTEERQKKISFVPFFESGLSIMVNKNDDTIHSIADLKGKRIAVQMASTGADVAHTIEGAAVRDFDHTPEALLELKQGGADAVILGTIVAKYYLATTKDSDAKMVEEPVRTQIIGLGIKKENTELKAKVEQALQKLKDSGEYQKLHDKYFKEAQN